MIVTTAPFVGRGGVFGDFDRRIDTYRAESAKTCPALLDEREVWCPMAIFYGRERGVTGDDPADRHPLPRRGYPARLRAEGRRLALLLAGHLLVFGLAIGHDEIVAECVAQGWLPAHSAEAMELLVGLVLFMCWSALTVGIVRLVDRARAETRGPAGE